MKNNRKQLLKATFDLGKTPTLVRKFYQIQLLLFFVLPLLALLLPWQQHVSAHGKVTALAPFERVQTIDSPINGVVQQWYVQEASQVKTGDVLLEMRDIDPQYRNRIEAQRDNLTSRLSAKQEELKAYRLQRKSLVVARDAKIVAAQFKRDMALQKIRATSEAIVSAQATLDAADFQMQRLQRLLKDGLVSKRDTEVAERDFEIAKRTLESAKAQYDSARAETNSAATEIKQITSDTQAELEATRGILNKIQAEVLDSGNSLTNSEINLSRQNMQRIVSPKNGIVFRLPFNSPSQIISQGQPLLVIQPYTDQPAIELMVDGRDAPLIKKGAQVRIEFEGWPAIQVPGWAKIRIGTYGGKVAFVDPIDAGNGNFRVMVVPDLSEQPWPSQEFLRQGLTAKGWILLQKVSIGYELWRIFNGFPPRIPEAGVPHTDKPTKENSAKLSKRDEVQDARYAEAKIGCHIKRGIENRTTQQFARADSFAEFSKPPSKQEL